MASRTYNVDAGSNKGVAYINIAQRGTAQTPTGLSSSSVWPVSTNDTIVIYVTGQDVYWFASTAPGWSAPGGVSILTMTATGNPYTFTFNQGLGSNSSTAYFEISGGFAGVATVYWSSSLDSISAEPTLTPTAVSPGSLVTDSFTVSGLSTGAKTQIKLTGGEIKINSGSWVQTGPVLAANSDTVNLRAYAPAFYDGSTIHLLSGQNAAGNGWSQFWEASTTANPTANYGIEVYNSNGNQTLSVNSRSARYVNSGVYTVTGMAPGATDSNTITITGMDTSDDWVVLTTHTNDMYITRDLTKATNQFTIDLENTSATTTLDCTVSWQVLLTG